LPCPVLVLVLQAIDTAPEGAQQRAVYLCNAAACYLKKEMWQLAVEQCTAALSINDTYLKVGVIDIRVRSLFCQVRGELPCLRLSHSTSQPLQHQPCPSAQAPQSSLLLKQ
jgi:hypothetical protein